MKRIHMLSLLTLGLLVGFVAGAAITTAYGVMPAFNGDQVVGQVGETRITRADLAQRAIYYAGDKLLDGEMKNSAIMAEAARVKGVSVTQDEINQYVNDSLQYAENARVKEELEATPRWMLESKFKDFALMGKLLNISVTKDEVDKFYDQNPKMFYKPARVRLLAVITTNNDDAKRAYQRLKDGEDPVKITKQISTDAKLIEANGDLGWFTRDRMSPRMGEAIFDGNDGKPLNPKQFTDIISYDKPDPTNKLNGTITEYAIFYVTGYEEGKKTTLETVRPMVAFLTKMQKINTETIKAYPTWLKQFEWRRVKDLNDPESHILVIRVQDAPH